MTEKDQTPELGFVEIDDSAYIGKSPFKKVEKNGDKGGVIALSNGLDKSPNPDRVSRERVKDIDDRELWTVLNSLRDAAFDSGVAILDIEDVSRESLHGFGLVLAVVARMKTFEGIRFVILEGGQSVMLRDHIAGNLPVWSEETLAASARPLRGETTSIGKSIEPMSDLDSEEDGDV